MMFGYIACKEGFTLGVTAEWTLKVIQTAPPKPFHVPYTTAPLLGLPKTLHNSCTKLRINKLRT